VYAISGSALAGSVQSLVLLSAGKCASLSRPFRLAGISGHCPY